MIFDMQLIQTSKFSRWVAFGAASVLLISACSSGTSSSSSNVRSATLSKGSISASVNATGNVASEAEIKLSFQAQGTAAKVNVKSGDTVKKGDALAVLDTTDLQIALAQADAAVANANAAIIIANSNYSRTVEGARDVDVKAAQAALNAAYASYQKVKDGPQKADFAAAEANYRNAEAALKVAQSNYDRVAGAFPAGIGGSPVSLALEQATNNFNAAKAQFDKLSQPADNAQLSGAWQQVQAAQASLDKAKQPARAFDVDQADAQRKQSEIQLKTATLQQQQAKRRLDQATLTAPTDGIISTVILKEGEFVSGAPVMTLIDNSILHIDVTVDEIDIARVKVGQDVQVTLDALPGVNVTGKVDRIAPSSTLVNGVVSYVVRVVLPNNVAGLKPGMTASTSITLDKRDGVLLAPNWAVRRDRKANKSYVTLRVDDKTTKEIEVVTGLRNDQFSEIVSGASDGQVVVAPQTPSALGQ